MGDRDKKLRYITEIYVRDGRNCRYCGRVMMPMDEVEHWIPKAGRVPANYPTLDHVVPKCRGGRFALDNLAVSCPSCNSHRKGNGQLLPHVAPLRRPIDARRCELCHGQGRGWNEDRDKPCPDCRGAGSMGIDRYAELLTEKGRALADLRHRFEDAKAENLRLREIIQGQFDADGATQAWRERQRLIDQIKSHQRTIAHLAARIEEMGGGRSDRLKEPSVV